MYRSAKVSKSPWLCFPGDLELLLVWVGLLSNTRREALPKQIGNLFWYVIYAYQIVDAMC